MCLLPFPLSPLLPFLNNLGLKPRGRAGFAHHPGMCGVVVPGQGQEDVHTEGLAR